MATVFVEARTKQEGSPEYVVTDQAGHVLATFMTRSDAIYWSKTKGHAPYVARVSHLNDRKNPDHWFRV